METEKVCGSCKYANYYSRREKVKIKMWIACEVYSRKYEKNHKACANWKEKANGGGEG